LIIHLIIFYAALRQAGNARTGGGKLSASRIRDVHAILSGALGLGARWGLRAVQRSGASSAAGAPQRRPAAHGRA
jgi:hypothetical protein